MRKARAATRTLAVAAAMLASPAAAQAADPAFFYTTPSPATYVRMSIEELGVLGAGVLQYTSTKSNEADWDVRADWPGVRSKILWAAASFDDNRFDTN